MAQKRKGNEVEKKRTERKARGDDRMKECKAQLNTRKSRVTKTKQNGDRKKNHSTKTRAVICKDNKCVRRTMMIAAPPPCTCPLMPHKPCEKLSCERWVE